MKRLKSKTIILKMVQLFYYESRGKCCCKVFSYHGYPARILLFPYEGWAQPALITYWLVKKRWWSKSTCKVVEVSGSRRRKTTAKIISDESSGSTIIIGQFTGRHGNNLACPDFKLLLTTNVSNSDFQMGYCMTGTLERGHGELQLTHYAMIKRSGY